jgi:hypothetical protein
MKHEQRDLEQLFAPPANQFGTHMLICGLSADTETLERIVASFTGESTVERAANGLIRAVLMLDASAPPMGPLAVPGLQRLAHCVLERWSAQTSLMHAKVALLGFADAKFAAPTTFRLVVSTGNWTRETWGNGAQIDMVWSTECRVDAAAARAEAFADASAALTFFERLMQALYPQSTAYLTAQPLAMGWLTQWHALLGQDGRKKKSRFIHSLDKSLFAQIKQRFPDDGVSTLVAGSGFWEQPGRQAGAKPEVLKKLDELTVRGERYLVANPQQAGAITQWAAANSKTARPGRIERWTLCTPCDPLQKNAIGRTFLHAKYIAGLSRVAASQKDKGTMTFLYLGSGNLSRAGLLSKAALGEAGVRPADVGNVEAGVVMVDKQEVPRVWNALACGDVLSDGQVKAMEAGADEQILKPHAPPPVLFAQVTGTQLRLIRGADTALALEVRIDAVGPWASMGAYDNELALVGSVPPIVWVRVPSAGANEASAIHEVPVLSEDGVCCRQAPNALEIDEVLEALLDFPSTGRHLPDPETPPSASARSPAASSSARRYPLKSIAALLEAIGQRNAVLTQEQFPVWLSQLRYLLLAQVSEADRDAIRRAGINLFPALLAPGFAPTWFNEVPQLKAAYQALVDEIAASWATANAVSCEKAIPNNGDERKDA